MCCTQSALSGFAWVDMFRLFYPETLHQDHQGIGRRLVDRLREMLSPAEFERVNQHLLQTDPFPGQAMHSKGLLGNGITTHEAYSHFQRLSAAVLTLEHNHTLAEPVKHWLEALTSALIAVRL